MCTGVWICRCYDAQRCVFLCVFLVLAVRGLQGVDAGPEGLKLISEVIRGKLGITMTVLMGANIANEVADEKFCETTIGTEDRQVYFLLSITNKQPVHKLTQQTYLFPLMEIGGHSGPPLITKFRFMSYLWEQGAKTKLTALSWRNWCRPRTSVWLWWKSLML